MQKKTVMFQFTDKTSHKVHDNSIVLYEYFEKCFIVCNKCGVKLTLCR